MEKALKSILSSNQAIIALVGTKISPIKRDDFPAITYEKTGRQVTRFANGQESDIKRTTFAIVAMAKTYQQAIAVSEAIESTLDNYRGTELGEQILFTQFNDETQNQLIDPDITEITLEYIFHHKQTN